MGERLSHDRSVSADAITEPQAESAQVDRRTLATRRRAIQRKEEQSAANGAAKEENEAAPVEAAGATAEEQRFIQLTGDECSDGHGGVDPDKLREWQQAHQLPPTGKVDARTLEAARAQKKGEDKESSAVEGAATAPSNEAAEPESKPMRKEADGERAVQRDAASALQAADEAGGAAQLPGRMRQRFETSLGADLSGVRLHTGAASGRAAQAIRAQAYTTGQDIHFAPGRFQPDTPEGSSLLAHEVAHTVQQRDAAAGPRTKLEVSDAEEPAEREADHAAGAMVAGRQAQVGGASGVQRKIMRFDAGGGGHQGIEREIGLGKDQQHTGLGTRLDEAAPEAGTREHGVDAIYAGNFMQDFSQINVPMFHAMLGKLPRDPVREALGQGKGETVGAAGAEALGNALVRALAILDVGPDLADSVVKDNMQVYRPEQHVDQPLGYSAEKDVLVRDSEKGTLRPGQRTVAGGGAAGGATETIDEGRDAPGKDTLRGSAVPGLQVENPALFEVGAAGLQNHIYNSVEWVKNHWLTAARLGPTDEGRFHVGAGLHAVEDYFSHSNFVEVGLNSYIDWALKHRGEKDPKVQQFLSTVETNERDPNAIHSQQARPQGDPKKDAKNPRSKPGWTPPPKGKTTHVDTMFDSQGKESGTRQAITTSSVGPNDMRASIAHILLPKVPDLQGAIDTGVEKMFGLVVSGQASSWDKLKEMGGDDRRFAAVLALGDGVTQAGVTVPVPSGLGINIGVVPYVDDIETVDAPFSSAISAYSAVVEQVREWKEQLEKFNLWEIAAPGITNIKKMVMEKIQEQLKLAERLKDLFKQQLNLFILRTIDSLTGVDTQDEANRTIGDALGAAEGMVGGLEQSTSLEARLLPGGDLCEAGMTQEEIEAIVGPVEPAEGGGWRPLGDLPPSHSEISKDHAPHEEGVETHGADDPRSQLGQEGGEALQDSIGGESLHPEQKQEGAGAEHDPKKGSIFYGLARALAVEADRHVLAQVEQMWASQGSLYGDETSLDTSEVEVGDKQVATEADRRASQEQQRAKKAGFQHAQSGAENQQLMKNRPEVKDLMDLVDLFIAHPDDSTWWKTVFDNYISGNGDEVAQHIQQRNATRGARRMVR